MKCEKERIADECGSRNDNGNEGGKARGLLFRAKMFKVLM
jgi:hypothetical protein